MAATWHAGGGLAVPLAQVSARGVQANGGSNGRGGLRMETGRLNDTVDGAREWLRELGHRFPPRSPRPSLPATRPFRVLPC